MNEQVNIRVNGVNRSFLVGTDEGLLPASETLLQTLRDRLGLTGSKQGCNQGGCGNCTVIVDGDAVPSCMMLTVDCDGNNIVTIEGLENPVTGELSPLQKSFVNNTAFQCGFCTPGIIMSATALLNKNPNPSVDEIREALSGNYCRCISHYQVMKAIEDTIKGRI
jgi:carbon-monoxide dehydrogenase small subunit